MLAKGGRLGEAERLFVQKVENSGNEEEKTYGNAENIGPDEDDKPCDDGKNCGKIAF